jgi:hypothetical protein
MDRYGPLIVKCLTKVNLNDVAKDNSMVSREVAAKELYELLYLGPRHLRQVDDLVSVKYQKRRLCESL